MLLFDFYTVLYMMEVSGEFRQSSPQCIVSTSMACFSLILRVLIGGFEKRKSYARIYEECACSDSEAREGFILDGSVPT